MNNTFNTLFSAASIAIVIGISAPAAAQTVLTPEVAVNAALSKNPDLIVNKRQVEQADLGVMAEENRYVPTWVTEAGYRFGSTPQLSASGTRQISTNSLSFTSGLSYVLPVGTQLSASVDFGRTVRDSVVLGDLGAAYDASFGFEVRQPLLRGFGADIGQAQRDIARNDAEGARIAQDAAVLELTTQVLQAYWALWSAQQSLKIQERALEIARQQLVDGEVRLEAGAISPAELTSLRAEIASATEAVVEAQATIAQRSNTLAALVGADPSQPLAVVNTPPTSSVALGFDESFSLASQNSPSLRQLQLELDSLGVRAEVADNNALPNLELVGSAQTVGLGYSATDALTDIGSSQIYYGGVRLELPLQNKARTAEADQATSAIEVAKARYAAAQRDLRAEVASVTTAIETATKRLELAKQSVELARESVEAQSARFDAGRATSFDVVNAIQALREAEFRAVTLEVEIVQQKLALEQLVRGVASAPPAS
jgi:outer membrane protein TolC